MTILFRQQIVPPDHHQQEIPEGSRYLLELDYSELYNSSFESQSYWVLAMKAARRAGRRVQKHRSSPRRKRRSTSGNPSGRTKRHVPRFDFLTGQRANGARTGTQSTPQQTCTTNHNRRVQPIKQAITQTRLTCVGLQSISYMLRLHTQLVTG